MPGGAGELSTTLEWKAEGRFGTPAWAYSDPYGASSAIGLQFGHDQANWSMASIKRAATAVAAILVREGVDYAQSKAVFKAARERAGLHAPPERRGGVDRLTVEEELRFLDQAYAQNGRTGLMLQTLLETGARASELVQLRIEDVSLAERVITIRHGKGDKRREVPIRRDLPSAGIPTAARSEPWPVSPSCSSCISARGAQGRCSPAASKDPVRRRMC